MVSIKSIGNKVSRLVKYQVIHPLVNAISGHKIAPEEDVLHPFVAKIEAKVEKDQKAGHKIERLSEKGRPK